MQCSKILIKRTGVKGTNYNELVFVAREPGNEARIKIANTQKHSCINSFKHPFR